jgi:hypothetical protein
MGQRLGPIASNVNWMAPHALAAQLQAQAGESLGRGYASFGQSIGQGLTNFGNNRKEQKRFDTLRSDRLAEQANDNRRQDERLQMERDREARDILAVQEEGRVRELKLIEQSGDISRLDALIEQQKTADAAKAAIEGRLQPAMESFAQFNVSPDILNGSKPPPAAATATASVGAEVEFPLDMAQKLYKFAELGLKEAKTEREVSIARSNMTKAQDTLLRAHFKAMRGGAPASGDKVRDRQVAGQQDKIAEADAIAKARGWDDIASAPPEARAALVKQRLSVDTADQKGLGRMRRASEAMYADIVANDPNTTLTPNSSVVALKAAIQDQYRDLSTTPEAKIAAKDAGMLRRQAEKLRDSAEDQTDENMRFALLTQAAEVDAKADAAHEAWKKALRPGTIEDVRGAIFGGAELEQGQPVETPGSVTAPGGTSSRVADRLRKLRGE